MNRTLIGGTRKHRSIRQQCEASSVLIEFLPTNKKDVIFHKVQEQPNPETDVGLKGLLLL